MKILILSALAAAFAFTAFQKEPKHPSLKKVFANKFSLVPSGNAIIDEDTISVNAFYILNTEVTNKDYREFLSDLIKNGETDKLAIAQIDSARWNSKNAYMQKYVEYYHNHPAYADFPIVNISHEAAQLYCEWLSQQFDKIYGFQGRFKFRLMEKAEYVRAARGDSDFTYSWGSHSVRNSKGQSMCNHTQLSAEHIHYNQEDKKYEIKLREVKHDRHDFVDVLAPSKSYWPNQFGVYNLNGNAAEMLAEKGINIGGSWRDPGFDVRVESTRSYEGPNPTTGFRVVMTAVEK